MTPAEFLNLSLAVQVSIAAGYLAYVLAYAGIRKHHTTADVVLKSAALGLPAMIIMAKGYQNWFATPVVAMALSLVTAIVWRTIGRGLWQDALRHGKVSWADDIPTAWLSVTATSTGSTVSQIAVETTDGRVLLCEDTRIYRDAHAGPLLLGLEGDIALYVDAEQRPDGTWVEKANVRHWSEGDLLTYVPAAQIKRVEIRYLTEKAAAAALLVEAAAAEEAAVQN